MRLWTAILDLLYPPKCPFCRSLLLQPDQLFCPACQTKLPWLEGERAKRKVDFTQGCFSALAYRDQVPHAIHRYKFSGLRAYGRPFGLLVAQCIQDHIAPTPDCLTWAPLSAKRLRQRGYDQAGILAQVAGKQLDIHAMPTLKKVRHTKPQSGLEGDSHRRANALNAYTMLPGVDVREKKLVLIDDVVTSGATLSECTRILLQAGAYQVWCVTLAQAKADSGEN